MAEYRRFMGLAKKKKLNSLCENDMLCGLRCVLTSFPSTHTRAVESAEAVSTVPEFSFKLRKKDCD